MRRVMRMGALLVLVSILSATSQAVAQGPAGTPATRRLVVFEAFIRPT